MSQFTDIHLNSSPIFDDHTLIDAKLPLCTWFDPLGFASRVSIIRGYCKVKRDPSIPGKLDTTAAHPPFTLPILKFAHRFLLDFFFWMA